MEKLKHFAMETSVNLILAGLLVAIVILWIIVKNYEAYKWTRRRLWA